MELNQVVDGVRARHRRSLARALSEVENADEAVLRTLAAGLHPHTGHAHIVGITGSPGAGKSTLTNALTAVLRGRGQSVAVLAIDPSSPFSGGALLGDRVRMGQHADDDGVYIRSMATRGHLGGLASAAPQAVMVLDAAGFDVVIIETVGVGQAEVEVARLADTTVVVQAPGMGDGIQAAKAGILEIADVHVVNKADLDGASRTARELRQMLGLGQPTEWTVPILQTAGSTGDGVEALADALAGHRRWGASSGATTVRRQQAAEAHLQSLVAEIVGRRARRSAAGGSFASAVRDILDKQHDPWSAAERVVQGLEL